MRHLQSEIWDGKTEDFPREWDIDSVQKEFPEHLVLKINRHEEWWWQVWKWLFFLSMPFTSEEIGQNSQHSHTYATLYIKSSGIRLEQETGSFRSSFLGVRNIIPTPTPQPRNPSRPSNGCGRSSCFIFCVIKVIGSSSFHLFFSLANIQLFFFLIFQVHL